MTADASDPSDPALFRPVAPRGGDVDPAVVREAAAWLARVQGNPAPEVAEACRRWREAAPDHELAWQRLCALGSDLRTGLGGLGGVVAGGTLQRADRRLSRRRAVKSSLALAAAGVLAWQAAPTRWRGWTSDVHAGIGERREHRLDDGTRIVLNTGSAIDIRYDDRRRQVLLRHGEILVQTAPDPLGRPFEVVAGDSRLVPVGTRFLVRDGMPGDADYRLTVLEGEVDVVAGVGAPVRVRAGEQAYVGAAGARAPGPAPASPAAWLQGMLVADGMPLRELVRELGRYRPGVLRCAPEVETWRVAGAFSVDDTDEALALLAEIMPVVIDRRTRYWVTVAARR